MIKLPRTAHNAVSLSCLLARHLRRLSAAIVFLFFLGVAPLDAQVKLWGLASDGASGFGSVFNLNSDGSDYNRFALPGIAGRGPLYTTLLKAANGKFYGMTNGGGTGDEGVLFEYDPAGTYELLHDFEYASGVFPSGSLIESGGKFYGMTHDGGDYGVGVIFEYNPAGAGTYTVLHHFDGATGSGPDGTLLESGGKFYGATFVGGTGGVGVFFEYDPSTDTYDVLHDFQYGNGSYPYASPIESGGKFYGTTWGGGVSDIGVIYELEPLTKTYTVLYNFEDATGSSPVGSLIQSGGKFYGLTQSGGNNFGGGVLFEFDPAGGGTYSALHYFEYATGLNPTGALLESGGKFYGMTPTGGSLEYGVLFEYNPAGSGTYAVLHDFDFDSGAEPRGSLMESDDKFYGLTYNGGIASNGVLFEYDPAGGGAYAVRVAFTDAPIGNDPRGRLIQSGGKFYGTARDGGTFDDGVIFEYDPAGSGTYTVLHQFDENNGISPYSGLTESGGKFYGTTRFGGDEDNGTLFVYDPTAGTHTVLHHFEYTAGSNPTSYLVESGGKFYGTALSGGDFGEGVLFQYDPASSGTYTVLHHFDYTAGAAPYGSLVAMGGKFYGTTNYGGDNFNGVLYEYDPAGGGSYNVLYHFDYATGSEAYGALLVSGGKLYGATRLGGDLGSGVLFQYDPLGHTYTPLYHFESTGGSFPDGSLIEVDGKFYGTTTEGGDFNGGVVFEFDPTGLTYTVLKHLSYQDGISPYCQLLAVGETTVTSVSGKLIWENDDATGVGNVTVTLSGDQSGSATTTAAGTYSFTVASGSDLTITPAKNINKLNGLTTADVTRIQRHVANIELLTDAYKIVAADVNKTNSVTSQDASIINQALLGNPSALNQIKTSWRFVPVSHNLNIPPWGFPENLTLSNVSGSLPNQDFYGIKTGDVISPFTNPANLQGEGFVLSVQDQSLEAGAQVTVTFSAAQFNNLAALQFALRFDADKLALTDIAPQGGLPLSMDHFGTYELSEGLLKMAWAQPEGMAVEEAAPLFLLTFNVLATGGLLSDALQLDDDALESHAYTGDLSDSMVDLAFQSTTGTGTPAVQTCLQLLQNRPNPFIGTTTISFVLPQGSEVQLRVFDASGRELFVQQQYYPAGKHEEVFEAAGANGVLWYELTTPSGVLTRKMIALNK